jgi:hypothetical protein
MPRYQVTGIPPTLAQGSELGLSAFLPHFHRLAASGAQCYKYRVTGHPGTARIPVHRGAAIPPSPDPGDMVLMGTSRSSDAPDAIWPNLYYTAPDAYWDRPGGTMHVQVYDPVRPQDTTMIPVPAVDLQGVYRARSANLAGGVASETSRVQALKQATQFVRWGRRRAGNGPGSGSP